MHKLILTGTPGEIGYLSCDTCTRALQVPLSADGVPDLHKSVVTTKGDIRAGHEFISNVPGVSFALKTGTG